MSTSIAEAFKRMDVDGSGSITKDELWSQIGEKNGGLGKKDFDALFGTIDQDKSGCISLDEYSSFMVQLQILNDKKRKSSMKYSTQKASLKSHYDKSKKKKKHSSGGRRGNLISNRYQKSFRKKASKKLDLDESNPQFVSERPSILRFFDVEVREYEVTASDNPGVKAGVALELAWNYNILERTHLDAFEDKRSTERSKDFKKEKKLSRLEREKILKEFGASQTEIQEAAKRAATIRNARKKSIGMRQHDQLHESIETKFTSPLKKIFRRKPAPPPSETALSGSTIAHDGGA